MTLHHSTSRLFKHERSKLVLQTTAYVVSGLAILVFFVMVLMPAAIKFFFYILDGNSSNLNKITDTLPPQVPILSLPYQATNSATVKLTGFGEAQSQVKLIVNGSEVATIQVDEAGNFQHELRLETGQNELKVYGVDNAKNESVVSPVYLLFSDAEPLTVDVSEPESGAEIVGRKNQTLLVKGKTKPETKVYLNDRLNYVKADGAFEIPVSLTEGENILKIKAVDKASNYYEMELKVIFKL